MFWSVNSRNIEDDIRLSPIELQIEIFHTFDMIREQLWITKWTTLYNYKQQQQQQQRQTLITRCGYM